MTLDECWVRSSLTPEVLLAGRGVKSVFGSGASASVLSSIFWLDESGDCLDLLIVKSGNESGVVVKDCGLVSSSN